MKSLVLIGMSGVGKSFIGKKIAEQNRLLFVDTDVQIEKKYGLKLHEVLAMLKEENFLQEEAITVESVLNEKAVVIAPGGSIVYSHETMKKICDVATVIYLKNDIKNILKRITPHNRGIVGLGKKTFEGLCIERDLLYARYADYTIRVDNKKTEDIVTEIISLIGY